MRASRLALTAALASLLVAACGGNDSEPAGDVIVMTRNLYLGAPIEPVLALTAPQAIPGAALGLWTTVVASDIPARARAVAAEIAAFQPDLVGLQEATLWRTQAPSDPLTAATHVEYDFVTFIVDELAARGLRYDPVAVSLNFDAELPASDGNPLTAIDVRMTDRDVILARSGVAVRDPADGRFTARVGFSLAGTIQLEIPRGWTSVVATVAGRTFRFVNTHLEIGTFEPIQVLQAQELTGVLASSALPTILVGDLNSNAIAGGGDNTPSYGVVTGAGFADLWATLHPGEPGLTCCQDGSLRNQTSALFERIDLVLHRGGFGPSSADVVGEAQTDRTPSGLWPSDHAGVIGSLRPPG